MKWERYIEFRSWTNLFAFNIELISFKKAHIQFISLQISVINVEDWAF